MCWLGSSPWRVRAMARCRLDLCALRSRAWNWPRHLEELVRCEATNAAFARLAADVPFCRSLVRPFPRHGSCERLAAAGAGLVGAGGAGQPWGLSTSAILLVAGALALPPLDGKGSARPLAPPHPRFG